LNKSCPPAFPPSQLRGIKPLPKNWEAGKAGGQEGRIYSTKPLLKASLLEL